MVETNWEGTWNGARFIIEIASSLREQKFTIAVTDFDSPDFDLALTLPEAASLHSDSQPTVT